MPSLTATLAPSASAPSSTSRAIEPRVGARETSASRDFANAMAALAHGDFGVSARQLRHFAATYPQDARAEDARYLEAIALQRAGRGDEAKAAAQRYLSAYPQGVHSEQALRIVGN
jgi:TolA-binding protein